MDNYKEKKDMTPEGMDQSFKEAMFKAFSQKIPGVHMDQDGYIVVPVPIRKKPSRNPCEENQPE